MRKARRFHCRSESVAGARQFVGDLLSDQPREIVEAAELMTSELATNCLRHARSDFELTIHLTRGEIRVELSDRGRGQPMLRSPTPRERSGRGLRIVQELSEDWESRLRQTANLSGSRCRCPRTPVSTHTARAPHAKRMPSRATSSSEALPQNRARPVLG